MRIPHLLIISLATLGSAAELTARDNNCANGLTTILGPTRKVCCPGVMKTKDKKGQCCIGGTDTCKPSQVTCFDDVSSCKQLVDISSDDYKQKVKDATGSEPGDPQGDIGGDGQTDAPGGGSGDGGASQSATTSGMTPASATGGDGLTGGSGTLATSTLSVTSTTLAEPSSSSTSTGIVESGADRGAMVVSSSLLGLFGIVAAVVLI